jgi:hypothetical protein
MLHQEAEALPKAVRQPNPVSGGAIPALTVIAALASLAGVALIIGVVGPGSSVPHFAGVSANVPVTAMSRTTQVANNSPELVADPMQPRFVVMANRIDFPDFSCALQVSGDGGRRWITANPVPRLPASVQKCYAPEVAFDGAGHLYYLFVGLAGAGNKPVGAFLTRSLDGARTFSPPRRVLGPQNFDVRMAIDPTMGPRGRIDLVWLHATAIFGSGFQPVSNPILAAHSDDGGQTFSRPVLVSEPSRARVVAPALALGPDHSVTVAYYDLGRDAVDYEGLGGPTWSGTWSLVVARSPDGGSHFPQTTVVDNAIVPPSRVMLIFTMPPPALAGRDDRICGAWTDARHGDPDALLRCSSDRGATWGPLVRLNDDQVGDGATQDLPQLSIAPNGRIDAIFFDRRADPANVLANVSYTFSVDGGKTFSRNVRLTQMASSSQIGAQYAGAPAQGQYEFGSRLGLLSSDKQVLAAWPDTRNSLSRTSGQDIFAAQVAFHGSGVSVWSRVVGAVLLVLGLGPLALIWRRRPRRTDEWGWERLAGAATPTQWKIIGRGLVVLAFLAVMFELWTRGSPRTTTVLVPKPAVAVVDVVEYHLNVRSAIPAGRVVFKILNRGRLMHSLWLIPLPPGLPPINVQLHGKHRVFVQPYAGVPELQPGQTGTFAVDLAPGQRYGLVDLDSAPTGQPEAVLGIATEFRTPPIPGTRAGGVS